MPTAVASRYATALVEVVTEPASTLKPQDTLAQLRVFQDAVRISPELRIALASPAVPRARKRAIVARLAEALSLSRPVRNLLSLLVDHRRSGDLDDVVESFDIQLDERLGMVRAHVTAAHALNRAQQAKLAEHLSQLAGKSAKLKFSEDLELIAGVVARIGSTVYDGSVRGKLESLRKRLIAE